MEHIAEIKRKPSRSGFESTPDGAICGNGDLSVILGNSKNGMRIFIAKSDLWHGVENAYNGGIRPFCYIDVDIPDSFYNNYHVIQDMDNAQLRCDFSNGSDTIAFSICVFKPENGIIIESIGSSPISLILMSFKQEKCYGSVGYIVEDNIKYVYRIFDGEECAYTTRAYGGAKKISDKQFYFYCATNHSCDDPFQNVKDNLSNTDSLRIDMLKIQHSLEWDDFWRKSRFELSDKQLELRWYASQYILAICAGNKKFPPGLYGNFITVEKVNWKGDYHLNYNYQAPFYAACSSNHVELTDCYSAPLEEMIPKAIENAKKFGCKGTLFPVGIQPKGLYSEIDYDNKNWFLRLFLGQKSNTLHAADIMIFRWKSTRDLDYARESAYPFVKLALAFFEDYLVNEKGRFSVLQDSIHEVPYYKSDFNEKKYKRVINDKNNVLTLGLLRLCLDAGIDMAKALDVDKNKQKTWQNILDYLAPFPVYKRFGKKVFRYTEKGQAWNNSGDVGLQHIYPCGCVGLSSDMNTLKIARDSFNMNGRWFDGNGVSSFYPIAARIGIEPKVIIEKMYKHIERSELSNLLFNHGGGCLEYCSIAANTLNEMALQSHQGIVRIFPNWYNEIDCSFENLRADGAFLVSASIQKGIIGEVSVYSEKGETLTLLNPFKKCIIERFGNKNIYSFEVIKIKTEKDELIKLYSVE